VPCYFKIRQPYPSCSWVRKTSKHGSSICIWKQLENNQKDLHSSQKKKPKESYAKLAWSNPHYAQFESRFHHTRTTNKQTNNRQCQQHTSNRSMIVNSSTVAGPDWIINEDLCDWMEKKKPIKENDKVCSRVSQEARKNKRTNERTNGRTKWKTKMRRRVLGRTNWHGWAQFSKIHTGRDKTWCVI